MRIGNCPSFSSTAFAVCEQVFTAPPAPPQQAPAEAKAAAAKAKTDPKAAAAAAAAAEAASAAAAVPPKPCQLITPILAAQLNPIIVTPRKVRLLAASMATSVRGFLSGIVVNP